MKDLCILIPTCSIYYNIWEPHISLFRKFWPNCPYDVYMGVDKNIQDDNNLDQKYNFSYIISDLEAKGANMLTRLYFYTQYLAKSYQHVLLLLDDLFLVRKISNNTIQECMNLFNNKKVGGIRLYPSPNSRDKNIFTKIKTGDNYPNIKKGEKYTDYICSHCLDLLYKPPPNQYLPHIYAGIEDSRIKFKHVKSDEINLGTTKETVFQPTIWDLKYINQIINSLINPDDELKKKIKDNEYNDKIEDKNFILFERYGKYVLPKDQVILCPQNRWDIMYPARGFCGGGICRGKVYDWALELFNKHNIPIDLYPGNHIFDAQKYHSGFKDYLKGKDGKYTE